MNQAILKILDEMIEEGVRKHNYDFLNDEETLKQIGYIDGLKEVKTKLSSLPSDTQGYTKKEVLDFAYWYHNGLLNRDRQDVEVEFDDFIKYHRKGLIPNKIIGN